MTISDEKDYWDSGQGLQADHQSDIMAQTQELLNRQHMEMLWTDERFNTLKSPRKTGLNSQYSTSTPIKEGPSHYTGQRSNSVHVMPSYVTLRASNHFANSFDSGITKTLELNHSLPSHNTQNGDLIRRNIMPLTPPCQNNLESEPGELALRKRALSLDQGYHWGYARNHPLHTSPRRAGVGAINGTDNPTLSPLPRPVSMPCTPLSHTNSTPRRSSSKVRLHLQTISENLAHLGTLFKPLKKSNRFQSKSEGDLGLAKAKSDSTPQCLDTLGETNSDDDNDDYGFLSHYAFKFRHSFSSYLSSAAMQKAKGASNSGHKILPKKLWRKSKLVNSAGGKRGTSLWRPEGSCTWTSMSGRKVVLQPVSLITITEAERIILQKIAHAHILSVFSDLGCSVTLPKGCSGQKRSKRAPFSLKRRTGAGGLLENLKDRSKEKDGKDRGSGWVFSIPLSKCISNDAELRRRKPSSLKERRESLDLSQTPRRCRKSSSSSGGGVSSDSLSDPDSKSPSSNLLDALSLSSSSRLENTRLMGRDRNLAPHTPHVPYIVSTCFKHLETYGLRVLGIFRIGSSKKRTKQLREEFDTGRDVKLNEEHNPHDVGGLLKEFFRDLPDPLLTRDLYSAFVASRKLRNEEDRINSLQELVALLPVSNRDTLWALLSFLRVIVQHSTDAIDENGQPLPGNKMDSHNLATLFGPNILNKARGGEFEVETLERADERQDIISVVKEMIEQQDRIFQLGAEVQDQIFRAMQESNPETVDFLLKRKSSSLGIDVDPETSSSFYEESDSSSLPHSPSYSSEMDTGHPRSLSEALTLSQMTAFSPIHPHQQVSRVRSADPPATSDTAQQTLKVPAGCTLSAPEQGWYRAERSSSPSSPRISPSPKAMKSAPPDLRISVTSDSPVTGFSRIVSASKALMSPRTRRARKQGGTSSKSAQNPHRLSVPAMSKTKDSSSSLSSDYCAESSRSGTTSPLSPEPPHDSNWYVGATPPSSPTSKTAPKIDVETEPFHRTSSTHRPLGFQLPMGGAQSASQEHLAPSRKADCNHAGLRPVASAEWQRERWKQWEMLARKNSDDFHEQETLV